MFIIYRMIGKLIVFSCLLFLLGVTVMSLWDNVSILCRDDLCFPE